MKNRRRIRIEELDSGWLVTISLAGQDDRLLGRLAFIDLDDMMVTILEELKTNVQDRT